VQCVWSLAQQRLGLEGQKGVRPDRALRRSTKTKPSTPYQNAAVFNIDKSRPACLFMIPNAYGNKNTGFCLRNTGFAFVKLAPSPDHFQRKLYLPCRTAADLEMQKINAAIQNPQSCMPLAAFVTHHFPHGEKKLRPSTTYGCKRLWDDHKSFCLADEGGT
jgi:hypothetical protein